MDTIADVLDEKSTFSGYWMKDRLIRGQIETISKEDFNFWENVIEKYLSPKGEREYKHNQV